MKDFKFKMGYDIHTIINLKSQVKDLKFYQVCRIADYKEFKKRNNGSL